MLPFLIAALVLAGLPTLYFAYRSREFRKFLAGAFFVSAGIQFYLYLVDVSVPLMGTSAVQEPRVSAARAAAHFVLFLICLYSGYIRKPKADSSKSREP